MAPRAHTDFKEIKIHTAKCDSCNKHNKLTIYRCMTCGYQRCTPCWNNSGDDGKHEFVIPSPTVQPPPILPVVSTDSEKQEDKTDDYDETQGPAGRVTKRKRVVSDDDEDNKIENLEGSPSTEKNENDAMKKKRIAVIKDDDENDYSETSYQVSATKQPGEGARKKKYIAKPTAGSDSDEISPESNEMSSEATPSNRSQGPRSNTALSNRNQHSLSIRVSTP